MLSTRRIWVACAALVLAVCAYPVSSNEPPTAPYTVVSWADPADNGARRCVAALLNPVWALVIASCAPSNGQSAKATTIDAAGNEVFGAREATVAAVVRPPAPGTGEQADFVLLRLEPAVLLPTVSDVRASQSNANLGRGHARVVRVAPSIRWSAGLDGNVLESFVVMCEDRPCAGAEQLSISPATREWLLDTLARSGEMLQESPTERLAIGGWFERIAADGPYRVKPGNRTVWLRGHVESPSILRFEVNVPSWNLAARCGSKQPKFACLWAAQDGRAHDRVCNGPRQRAGPRRFSLPLAAGPFEVSVASDESDGCGWPRGTDHFSLTNPRISGREAKS